MPMAEVSLRTPANPQHHALFLHSLFSLEAFGLLSSCDHLLILTENCFLVTAYHLTADVQGEAQDHLLKI